MGAAEDKKRPTLHNGRTDKNGKPFTTIHNDQRYAFEADHIDTSKSPDNWTWMRFKEAKTFEECEQLFYKKILSDGLNARNERYRKNGHSERIRTMDEYRKNPKSCPEEQIMQVGKRGDSIDKDLLIKLAVEQINWEHKTFPNVKYLDVACHVDEPGAAPHIQSRRVWIAPDKDGNWIVSQNKALEQMGIERPDLSKPKGRYNNAKITYTKMCREHFIELCQKHGLDIETTPREPGKSGLSLMELKANTAKETLSDTQKTLSETRERVNTLNNTANELNASVAVLERKKGHLLKTSDIDVNKYKKPLFRNKMRLIPEQELKDLQETAAVHRSVDEHILAGEIKIKKMHTEALRKASRDISKAKNERDTALADLQQTRRELDQIQSFVDRICDRSALTRQWYQLWMKTQPGENMSLADAKKISRANQELRQWEHDNNLLSDHERRIEKKRDISHKTELQTK